MYHPVEDLSASLEAALLRDLPPLVERVKDWDAWKKIPIHDQKLRQARFNKGEKSAIPMTNKSRRPVKKEVEVSMFLQTWEGNNLGFARKGEPVETLAYTVIVQHDGAHAVYFGGKFAYLVMGNQAGAPRTDAQWQAFVRDAAKKSLVACEKAAAAYKAISINKFGSNAPQQLEQDQE